MVTRNITAGIVWFGAISISILIILAGLGNYRAARDEIVRQFNNNQMKFAELAAVGLEEFFNNLFVEISDLSDNPALLDNDVVTMERIFPALYKRFLYKDALNKLMVIDSRETIKYTYPHSAEYENKRLADLVSDHEFENHFGPLEFTPIKVFHENRLVVLDFPLTGRETYVHPEKGGFIRAVVDFGKLAKIFINPITMGENGHAFILDQTANVLVSTQESGIAGKNLREIGPENKFPRLNQVIDQMVIGQRGIDWYNFPVDWREEKVSKKLVAYVPLDIHNVKWSLAVATPFQDVVGISRDLFIENFLSAIVLIILIFGVSTTVVRNEKMRLKVLKNRNDRLRAVNNLMTAINDTLDLDKILYSALTELKYAIGVEKSIIYLWDEKTDELEIAANLGAGDDFIKKYGQLLVSPEQFLFPVINEKKLMVIPDVLQEKAIAKEATEIWKVKSMILVPLEAKRRIVGVLGAASGHFNYFTEEHQKFLVALGTQLGVAINNARLFKGVRRKSQQLQMKNKELDSFVDVVTHDLKAPVALVHGFSTLALENYGEKMEEKEQDYINRILHSAEHMAMMIQDLSDLSRVDRIQDRYERLSTTNILKQVLSQFQALIESKNVELLIQEELPDVTYIKVHLHQVFTNIISNSIKFSGVDGNRPVIEVGCYDHPFADAYTFFIRDNGIGIDPDYQEDIFNIFYQIKDIDVEGSGVGLSIIKKIIELNGGEIWVESEVGKGSTFFFTIPKNLVPGQPSDADMDDD